MRGGRRREQIFQICVGISTISQEVSEFQAECSANLSHKILSRVSYRSTHKSNRFIPSLIYADMGVPEVGYLVKALEIFEGTILSARRALSSLTVGS